MSVNIFKLIYLFIMSFIILFLPALCFFKIERDRGFFEKLMVSLIINVSFTIYLVYFLAFCHVLTPITLLAFYCAAWFLYLYFFRRGYIKEVFNSINGLPYDIPPEVYGLYYRGSMMRNFIKTSSVRIKAFLKLMLINLHEVILMLISFSYLVWHRSYNAVNHLFYGTSDLYVHTYWIKMMGQGNIFSSGVYPFGVHNIIYTISSFTGLDLSVVMNMFGVFCSFIIVLSMYFALKTFLRSSVAAAVAVLFYCVCNVVPIDSVVRQMFALPQEFAMIFLYPCALFLHKYLNGSRKSDLIYFVLSFALTLLIHFYVTVAAALICIIILAVNINKIFTGGRFLELVKAFCLILIIPVLPLVIGLLMGRKWEGSMTFAINFLTGASGAETEAVVPAEPGLALTFMENFYETITKYININWFYIFIGAAAVAVLYSLVLFFIKAHRERGKIILSFTIFSFIITSLALFPVFGLPLFMESIRILSFMFYIYPIIFVIPIDAVFFIVGKKNIIFRIVAVTVAASVYLSFGYYLFSKHAFIKPGYVFQNQYDGAMECYNRITMTYPNGHWTIVSPTEEVSIAYLKGYHYEIQEFILKMENMLPTTEIIIPTEYVFIYVEKAPLKFNRTIFLSNPYPEPATFVSEELAAKRLVIPDNSNSRYAYMDYDARCILMSKAYYYAQKLMQYYPTEVSVFYEDSEMIVYQVKQKMTKLRNFAISYGYNTRENFESTPSPSPESTVEPSVEPAESTAPEATAEPTETEEALKPEFTPAYDEA